MEQRRAIVRTVGDEFDVDRACRLVGLARSTFYYQPRAADELAVRRAIEAVAVEYPRYGYRRVQVELERRGVLVNHKRVLRLMREDHLLVQVKRYCRTTFSRHPYGRYPNLVKGLAVVRPDQVWCGDITYIELPRGFVYLAVLMDVFTRAIRGWELGRNLTEELSRAALERALSRRRPEIHHSDQGVQYAANGYIGRLEAAGVQVSMSAQGRPTENAYAERLMRTLKEEEVHLHEYVDFADAYAHLERFIEVVYMHKRVHSALGYLPPAEFEAQWRATVLAAEEADGRPGAMAPGELVA